MNDPEWLDFIPEVDDPGMLEIADDEALPDVWKRRRNPDDEIRRLLRLASEGNSAAALAAANILVRTLGVPTPQQIAEAIQPLLVQVSEACQRSYEWRDEVAVRAINHVRATLQDGGALAPGFNLAPGMLISSLCSNQCNLHFNNAMTIWASIPAVGVNATRSITLHACPAHRAEQCSQLIDQGFDIQTVDRARLFVPFYDVEGRTYPGNILPGYYSGPEVTNLLRYHRYNPEAIAFLADMLEE